MASIKALLGYLNQKSTGFNWSFQNNDFTSTPFTTKEAAYQAVQDFHIRSGNSVIVKINQMPNNQFQLMIKKKDIEEKYNRTTAGQKRLYFKLFTGRPFFILNKNQASDIIKMNILLDKMKEERPEEYKKVHLEVYRKIIKKMVKGEFDYQGTFKTIENFENWKTNLAAALKDFQSYSKILERSTSVSNILQMKFFDNIQEVLNTQLLKAFANKNMPAIVMSLMLGADINVCDEKGNSLVNVAVARNDPKMVDFLVKRGAKINKPDERMHTPLITAVKTGNTSLARRLLNMGANPHLPGANGNTALMEAAANNHIPFIRMLLTQGVDISVNNIYKKSAIDFAREVGAKSAAELLTRHCLKKLIKTQENKLFSRASSDEWEYAKAHCPEGKKLHKKDPNHKDHIKHSFIKINDMLYVFDAGKDCYLGEGNFSKVKRCMREDGKIFAVAIRGEDLLDEHSAEDQILGDLLLREGKVNRKLDRPTSWLEHEDLITEKSYTVLALEHGKELYDSKRQLSELDKLFVARETCIKIDEMHKMGFVHRDIKPENMLHHQIGFMHCIRAIDFGFAAELDENGKIPASRNGSLFYTAPEGHVPTLLEDLKHCDEHDFNDRVQSYLTNNANPNINYLRLRTAYKLMDSPTSKKDCYSTSMQDVYSLGAMFQRDLKMKHTFVFDMQSVDPKLRPSLSKEVIPELEMKIAEQLGIKTKSEMDQYFEVLDGMKVIMYHLQEDDKDKEYSPQTLDAILMVYHQLEKCDIQNLYKNYQHLLSLELGVMKRVIDNVQFPFKLMMARKDPDKLLALIKAYEGPRLRAPRAVAELMNNAFKNQEFELIKCVMQKFDMNLSEDMKNSSTSEITPIETSEGSSPLIARNTVLHLASMKPKEKTDTSSNEEEHISKSYGH